MQCGHVFSSFAAHPHYDGFWGDEVAPGEHPYWSRARVKMHREFFRKYVEGKRGRLLDMGCGLGYFVQAAGRHSGWDAHGYEISPAAVQYAREVLKLENVNCGRLEDAGFPAESFDIVTLWDVLDHIPRPDPVLRRCQALLKPGGLLFIRTPNIANQLLRSRIKRWLWGMRPDWGYMKARDHAHHYSAESIARLLDRNGFDKVDFVHLPPIDPVGNGAGLIRAAQSACYQAVRILALATAGRLNLDNLFVAAWKSNGPRG
jgi:ubiquinone/menaquinone biosynthesis C-methylase UbiE